jgi:hypothetical protein
MTYVARDTAVGQQDKLQYRWLHRNTRAAFAYIHRIRRRFLFPRRIFCDLGVTNLKFTGNIRSISNHNLPHVRQKIL